MVEDDALKKVERALQSLLESVTELKESHTEIRDEFAKPVLDNLKVLKESIERLGASHAKVKAAVETMVPDLVGMKHELETCKLSCPVRTTAKVSKSMLIFEKKIDSVTKKKGLDAALRLAEESRVKLRYDWYYWYRLAIMYSVKDRVDDAISSLEKSVGLAPMKFEPKCGLIHELMKKGDYQRIVNFVSDIVTKTPMVPCHELYALIAAGLSSAGQTNMETVVEGITHPKRPECTPCLKAYLYLSLQNDARAFETLKASPKPKCKSYPVIYAAALGGGDNRGEFLKAVGDLNVGLKMDFFNALAFIRLLERFKSEQECDVLTSLIQRIRTETIWGPAGTPPQGSFVEVLGSALQDTKCGNHSLELELFQESAKSHECPTLRRRLLEALMDSGMSTEAVSAARDGMKTYPDNPDIAVVGILVLAQTGNGSEASSLIESGLGSTRFKFERSHLMKLLRAAQLSGSPASERISQMIAKQTQ